MSVTSRPSVEFFYCSSCPWTYLAFVRLVEAATRTGGAIVYRPILSAWIDQRSDAAFAGPLTHANPRVSAYARKDLQDWAQFCGVSIDQPVDGPVDVEWAQRGAIPAIEAGRARPYIEAVFRAHFADGRDVADRAVILEIAAGCGLSGAEFGARLGADDVADKIRRNCHELVDRGGFGSPTMFAGGDMYYGHDRMPLVESALLRGHAQPFIAPGEHGR